MESNLVLIRFTPLLAALALFAGSCSASATEATSTTIAPTTSIATTTSTPTTTTTAAVVADNGFPATIQTINGSVTIDEKPQRIVSISPTATEILFAVGAGDQVVAVDSLSNYPPTAPITELSAWAPSIEAIATFDPDLVFLSFDPGDVVAGLEAIGIDVIVHPTALTLDDAYLQWEQTGTVTGHGEQASELVSMTQYRMEAAVGLIPDGLGATTYYYELDNTYFTTTSGSFIGNVIAMTGMANVADAAPDPDGFGFPQLAEEYIVDADPSVILLADTKCCGQSAETVAQRPGWDTLSAVENSSVVELDDDVASRWSPRIADLLDSIVDALVALEQVDA
jgi:iron complex transport system substrate-binding protein